MRQTISKKYQDQIFDATIAYDDNPEALAAYIENGGDLDAGARKNLASLIRRYFPKPRGGKNIRSDVDFYMFVREWCLQEPFNRVAEKLRRQSGEVPSVMQVWEAFPKLGEHLTTEDGLKHVIETGAFGVRSDAEIGGLRKKFDRGRDRVNGKN